MASQNTKPMLQKICRIASRRLFVCFLLALSTATFGQVRNADHTSDQVLRSRARVNPSTLGMELSIPIVGYPGRANTGMPLTLNYSSKAWQIRATVAWVDYASTVQDHKPQFARHSYAGWSSSLSSPRIDMKYDAYQHSDAWGEGQPWVPPSHDPDSPPPSGDVFYANRLRETRSR